MCTVKLFGGLRARVGQAQLEVEGATTGEVLARLVQSHEALQEVMFNGEALQTHVRVMLNGRDIELLEGLDTAVTANDQLAVFPPLAGG